MEPTEDDALTYSLNVENSVEKISWLDEKKVACITQSNDLQLWDVESGDMIKSYSREKVAKGIKVNFQQFYCNMLYYASISARPN